MGGAQSAQREDKKDSAAEESGKVDDAQTEQHIEDKLLKNNGQISEISGKADATIAQVNVQCEDEIAAEAIVLPEEDVSEGEKPLKEETPLENLETNENKSPNAADANEEVPLEMIEMDAKQNDINESFRRFFSNINVKVTVKRGSAEKDDIASDVPDDTTKEVLNRPEGSEDTTKANKSENAKINMGLNAAQEVYDHDSTCPALTNVTTEDVLEKAAEKTTETKGDSYSENADATLTVPEGDNETIQQNATFEEGVGASPMKRFFISGIFSGLRKKRKSADDETTENELIDMRKVEAIEATEQNIEVQEHDKEISLGIEAVTVETEHKVNGLKKEILSAESAQTTDEGKSGSTDPSTIIANEPEILSSQEKDKVQASPLKRLLSGSSFKKASKKQRERKSSDAQLSDSGEHVSHQLLSSTEAADYHKEESPAGEEEDGAWASFKKLVTPKKRMKRSFLTNEETQNPSSVQESKSSEGEQMSDHSTEESKKRKDSSVSWEAVLCGSGRRRSRSRKTSDSEDEKPQVESDNRKQESPLESSNEVDKSLASYPKQAESPSEADGGSTWKSFKKLVTPKRKAKDEDLQSDGEATQDDSSFSIKKLLPGQKKRKAAEKQDYTSSDEADKELPSCDEDSETPAVIPLSEFDTVETGVDPQTHAEIETHIPKEADYELLQDLEKMSEPGLLSDSLQSEAIKVQDNQDALENDTSTTPGSNEEPDEITELVSKHQQLSDIPEEGIITETMVTPTSVTEQPARDDTIAEDLLEITSEAITAPEPVDTTLADETEMISAVSQLSESSKTSGNTTPVPAEYDVKDTEVLLQQVAENISMSPNASPLCSDELGSERIVATVSCQILETFVKEQPTILKIHRRSDATAFKTGLTVQELDGINELAATAQTESIIEVNEAVSTEIVSEVSTKFDNAEIAVDEIHEVSVTHMKESIKELENNKKSQDLMETQSEHEAVPTEILSESEQTVECSLAEAQQAETETPQADIGEEDAKDKDVEREDNIMQKITDQIQAEHQDQPCVVVQDMQALVAAERGTFDLEEDIVQSPEKKAAEDIPAVEKVMDEHKDAEPEKEDKIQADEVPDVSAVQPAELDSQISSIQRPRKEVSLSEDFPPAETATEQPEGQFEPLTEVHVEREKEDELQADVTKTEHGQVSEKLAVQVGALASQISSIQIPEKEVLSSEDNIQEKALTDKPKGQPEPLTEFNVELEKEDELPADSAQTELGQVQNILAVQEAALDSQMVNIQTPERKVPLLEDILAAGKVTDEPKGHPEPLIQVNVEPEMKDKLPGDAAKIEQVLVSEILGGVQATAVVSHIGSIQMPEKEVRLSEDIKPEDAVTDEPKEETQPVNEVNVKKAKKDELHKDAANTEHEQDLEVLAVQEAALESNLGCIQTLERKVPISGDSPPEKAGTDDPKEETEPLTEVHVEPEKEDERQDDAAKTEHDQVSEKLAIQVGTLASQISSIQIPEKEVLLSEDIMQEKAPTDKPKGQPEPLTEFNVELEKEDELPTDSTKTELGQVLNILAVQEVALDSQMVNIQTPERKVPLLEDILPAGKVTDEPKGHPEPLIQVSDEPEKKDKLPGDAAKIEQVLVSEILGGVQVTAVVSHIGSIQMPEKEVRLSEDIKPEDAVTDEPKEETQPVDEVNVKKAKKDELHKDAANTEHEQDLEVLAVQEAALESNLGCIQTLERKVPISGDSPPEKAGTDDPKEETEPLTEVHVEPEKEDELQADYIKPEEAVRDEPKEETEPVNGANTKHEQDPEVIDVKAGALDSQTSSSHIPEKEVPLSEDILPTETATDEPKVQPEPLTEVHVEPEKKDKLQVDAAKTEHGEIPEVSAVQAGALVSQISSIQIPEKEVPLSEDIPPAEIATDEPKHVEPEKEDKLQADAAKTEHGQVPEILDVQETALDSQIGSIQIPEKKVPLSEDNKPEHAVTGELKDETQPVTEVQVEPEKKDELQADAAKTEHCQEPEALAVQEAALDLQMANIQTPVRKVPLSEDIPPTETVTDEPRGTTGHLTVSTGTTKSEIKEPLEDAPIMDHHQDTVALETVQVPTFDLEQGSAFEKDTISEEKTVTDEPKKETQLLPEVIVEQMDESITEHVQEPEVLEAVQVEKTVLELGSVESLQMEAISEETQPTETFIDEPRKATEGNAEPVEEFAQTEHIQEFEVLQYNVKDPVTETESEKEILTDETEIEMTAESNQDLEINKDETREIIPQNVQVELEDRIPEDVDNLQTLSAVHASSVSEEKNRVQVLEKKVISEKSPAPCLGNATVTYEPKYEVHLSDMESNDEGEKEGKLPGTEVKTSIVQHAVVGQVITCNLKEVSAVIPDVLTEKPSNIHEPFIDTVISEQEFKEEAEIAIPLVKDDLKDEVAETATEHSVVVMMHVPSAELEDNHRIQVQVVEAEIKSAESNVDLELKVGVIEANKVIDVCHETTKVIDKLSATEDTEEELIKEESEMINHQVIQHVKENLPERVVVQTSIQDEVVNLEHEHKKQLNVTEVSEMAESKLNEVENRKAMEDTSGTFSQSQEETPVSSDDPAAEQPVSDDVMQAPNIPESLEVSIHDHKEKLEEHKTELKKSEAGFTAEEVKLSSEGLETKKINKEGQTTQSSLSQTVIASNTGLEVPKNTGIISSTGNLESPSSLSLEFKLNIQFGQAKAPAFPLAATEKTEASLPPATERTEPAKQTNMSEVGVQVVEPPQTKNQTLENQKKTVVTEVTVQTTEITEPQLVKLDTTEKTVIMKPPVVLDISIQAMETAQPAEQIKSTETLTHNVSAKEETQAVMQTEKSEGFLSQPVLYEVCYEEIKVEEIVKQIEEENDQDLWVDAEEDIHVPIVQSIQVEEPVAPRTESDEEEKAELECEFEMAPETAPKFKTQEEKSQQEMQKMGEICEIENEVEEFAVALEHPETAPTAIE